MRPKSRSVLAAAALLALSGCGSGRERTAAPPQPRLPRALAQDFARRSDEIARRLDAGDACGALEAATALQRRSIAAIGRVPAVYQETLQGTINDIAARIQCVPPKPAPAPAPAPHPKPHEHGHGHGKHKDKHGHGEGD